MNLNARYALHAWMTMLAIMVAAWVAFAPLAYGGEVDPTTSAAMQETDQGVEGVASEKPDASCAADEGSASSGGTSSTAGRDASPGIAPAESDIAAPQDAELSVISGEDAGKIPEGADSPREPETAPELPEPQAAAGDETEGDAAGAVDDAAPGSASTASADASPEAPTQGDATPVSISTVAAETSTAAASEQTAAPVAKPAAAKKAAVKKARTGKGNLAAGVYFIVSKLSKSKVVSIAKKLKKNGSNAVLWSIIGDGNQQWRVIIGKDGYATLKNVKTGKVLTVADKSKDSGTSVVQWKAKKKLGKAQKWIIKKKGSYFYVVSALNKKLVLNVNKSKKKNGTVLNV